DIILEVTKSNGALALKSEKAKDSAGFAPFHFRLAPYGPSLALEPDTAPEPVLSAAAETALATLREFAEGVSFSKWKEASGLTDSTFKRARTDLVEARYVVPHNGKYLLGPRAQTGSNGPTAPTGTEEGP